MKLLDEPGTLTYDWLNNDTIPAQMTTYHHIYLVFNKSDVHITGIEYLLDENTMQYVHHFTLFGFYADKKEMTMIWAWAPGVENLVLPKDVGFRIGNGSLPILELGIHFNNPGLVSGLFDRSGIRIYYNTNLRKFDAGVLFLGDGVVTQIGGVEPGDGYKEYEYDCCSNCSARWGHNLNVFASFLHMHQVGSQAWSTLYREEKKIMEINRIDYYNFGMQQQTPKKHCFTTWR